MILCISYLIKFDRPWNGGPKYGKRVNRLFFLTLVELMGNYGIGSRNMKDYLKAVREKIMEPLSNLYPLTEDSEKLVKELKINVKDIASEYPEIVPGNDFWHMLVAMISKELVANKHPDDKKEFKVFLDMINKNLDIADEISKMKYKKINPSAVYDTDIDKLF